MSFVKPIPVNHEAIAKVNLGFSAASFAGILSLLQVPKLDIYLTIFLICFSIVLPINLLFGLASSVAKKDDLDNKYIRYSPYAQKYLVITTIVLFVGIVSLILHFSLLIGIIFGVITLISEANFSNIFMPNTHLK